MLEVAAPNCYPSCSLLHGASDSIAACLALADVSVLAVEGLGS